MFLCTSGCGKKTKRENSPCCYCRRAQHFAEKAQDRPHDRQCAGCDTMFAVTKLNSHQRWCSRKCRDRHDRGGKPSHAKECYRTRYLEDTDRLQRLALYEQRAEQNLDLFT